MFLNIGLNYLIDRKHIVGIYDIETTTGSAVTKQFLTKAQKENRVVAVAPELPRSFIVYEENGKTTVYLSQFSTATLQKRNRNETIPLWEEK